MIPLPIDGSLPDIVHAAETARAVVVTAAPGAGKTTRVPPALLGAGPLVLLQPRRVAARAIASRIADEQRWTIGREVGWQVRSDARRSVDTRLLVVTEGILTRFFQSDPLLSAFNTVVLDEFHERSIHADLGIAFAKQAWKARDDLRIVVMSATIDTAGVAQFLNDCPVIAVPGSLHPIEIECAAGSVSDGVTRALTRTVGDVLCFLPGAFEIAKAIDEVRRHVPDTIDLMALHGALDARDQDAALRPSRPGRRRVVVATNIAETSLTVPGIRAVVDAGSQKVARYDATRGIDSLEIERITLDSADQRAGRAGRLGPGYVCRLWDARDRLRPHREADIARIDLAGPLLDLLAWGGSPETFEWFERPPDAALASALELLRRLGAVEGTALTALGRDMNRYGLHPRLSRMLIAAGGSETAIRACALLAERGFTTAAQTTTASDLLTAADDWHRVPSHVQLAAVEIAARMSVSSSIGRPSGARSTSQVSERDFLRAVLAAYPDRVAQRRGGAGDRLKLSTGAGATLARESGVRHGEFLVAVDVRKRTLEPSRIGNADEESIVRVASAIQREWLTATRRETVHRFDETTATIRALVVESYDELTLGETPVHPDPAIAADMLADAWRRRGPQGDDVRLLQRLTFAGLEVDVDAMVRAAADGLTALADLTIGRTLPGDVRRQLDRDAPETLSLPSGRSVPVDYSEREAPGAAAKLQELFGLAETPRLGPRKVPLVLTLLAPNGRPVQITKDLRSFWTRTYPEVRRELRARYPRHPWPEDPWTATPTARTVRRPTRR